jgi:NAD+ kinase
MRTILLTPIAPHLTVVRALVLPPTTHVQLTVHTEQDCTLSIDGQLELGVHDGDVVVVTASERTARFIRLRERTYFYQTLVERLSTTIARGMP